jgi:hypothetical protein
MKKKSTWGAKMWSRFIAITGPLNLIMFFVGIPLGWLLDGPLGRIVPERLMPPYDDADYGPEGMGQGIAVFRDCGWITVFLAVGVTACLSLIFSS